MVKNKKAVTKMASTDDLIGMKAICGFLHLSEPTVLDLIRREGMPAVKLGGRWEGSKKQIAGWKNMKSLVSTLNGGK